MKSGKGIQGPAPEPEKDTKMEPQGAKMEPRGHKVKPQGSRKYKKSATWTPRDSKWSPWCHIGAPRSPKMQNTHKKLTQIAKKTHQKVPRGAKQRRKTIYPQTTNQPTNQNNKEGHKETNNRTNTHTHKSFELQTQTQTPAAGCSPKAT